MKEILIPQELVDKIQYADYKVRGLKTSSDGLLEAHLADESTAILQSAIFKGLQEELGEAVAEFDKSKDDMLRECLPKEDYEHLDEWNLVYATCTLLYSVK